VRKLSLIAGAAIAVAAAAAFGSGISAAGMSASSGTAAQDSEGADGPEAPLTGTKLERATQAALAHTGGGTVTETESGDDGAAYSVEIRRPDGRNVEIQLDDNFKVIGEEADD
jgi:uncharacterized membrane protein YkoI